MVIQESRRQCGVNRRPHLEKNWPTFVAQHLRHVSNVGTACDRKRFDQIRKNIGTRATEASTGDDKAIIQCKNFRRSSVGISSELFPQVPWFSPSAPKTAVFPEIRTTSAVPKQGGQQQIRITAATARAHLLGNFILSQLRCRTPERSTV